MKQFANTIWGRIVLAFVIGFTLTWAMSEVAFLILKDSSDHVPQRVELAIPAGAAERVAAGEAPPSIPADMVFVVGDTLVVKNEDSVSHQLGPVWVPPGATASLALDQANNYAYACTFLPSQYMGLDVRSRVTTKTRLQALLLAGPPMAALIAIYSFVIFPLRPSQAAGNTAAQLQKSLES
ncbi:MAG: hypothetical protein FJ030_17070 [Chloroflexi bacterium]|nr:hypothetical protein [Chloroflexota bacterium]